MNEEIVFEVKSAIELTTPSREFLELACFISSADLERIDLGTDPKKIGNLRDGSRRSAARKAMVETANGEPELFPAKHRGIIIHCDKFRIDDGGKLLSLVGPVLVDGALTRSALQEAENAVWIRARVLSVKSAEAPKWYDLGVTLNTGSTPSKLSELGKLGYFDLIEEALNGRQVRKSETDSKDYIDTRQLISCTFWFLGVSASHGDQGLNLYRNWCDATNKADEDKKLKAVEKLDRFFNAIPTALNLLEHVKTDAAYATVRSARYDVHAKTDKVAPPKQRINAILAPAMFVYGGCGGVFEPTYDPQRSLDREIAKYWDKIAREEWDTARRMSELRIRTMEDLQKHFLMIEATKSRKGIRRRRQNGASKHTTA